jgi:hypothetical protein
MMPALQTANLRQKVVKVALPSRGIFSRSETSHAGCIEDP